MFSGAGNSRFSEVWNLWSLEFAKVWSSGILVREEIGSRTCGSPEPRAGDGANFGGRPIRESVEGSVRESRARTCANRRRSKADSGICWGPSSGVTREDIHEPAEKQSQSCCPKKSGFRVWTSGRFVNMLGEKDILVCVHTENILWAWGCFGYVKVPSSPYKTGRKGTCKRIQTFWNLCNLQRESQSLWALTLYLERVKNSLSCVREVIRTFRVTPNTHLVLECTISRSSGSSDECSGSVRSNHQSKHISNICYHRGFGRGLRAPGQSIVAVVQASD
jgi:hypothetical protein